MAKQTFINQEEISHYLKDVRKKTVLTPKREKELSIKIQDPTTTETEKRLIEQELIEGNLRFVITVAKDYQGQGISLADLIAEGNFGLLKAINNFDWSKGFRFISYAVWWIKQSVLQSLNEHSRTIRLPVNIVQELQRQKKRTDNKITKLDKKLANLPTTISLDRPINEEGDMLIELLPNENSMRPDSIFENEFTLKEELKGIMRCLDDREIIIVREYYGLDGVPKTLQEIGDDFSLTKERVRQIKEKALRKLRNDSYSLLDYLTQ